MKRGFVALQKIVRKKLQKHETEIWRQLKTSEREFQIKLRGLKERRQMQEKIFDDLKHTPSDQFQNAFLVTNEFSFKQPRKKYSQEIGFEDDCHLLNKDIHKENAALAIQLAVRKWLHKRRRDHLAKSQPFLNKPLTEERAIKLQQDIDAWQHHHRVCTNQDIMDIEFIGIHSVKITEIYCHSIFFDKHFVKVTF